ncbi:probable receptor-like protein kinase At2g42960 [Morus notabilis]|uniref:probable receptor-like protein kinase At2g42960 n=1 Tax=Morus notabilis TaxID=981085 RepID=UPI000CED0D03|nr:probable receptor-like protein kinase At2g42960 [Morus notabilis]
MDESAKIIMAGFLSFAFSAIILITAEIMICKSKRANSSHTQATQVPNPITLPNPNPITLPNPTTITVEANVQIAPLEVTVSFDPSLQISLNDITTATKNFSADLITADGRFGFVYKAELPNGLKLAVKKLDPEGFHCFMEFRSELEILGKLRHRNIVRLLGYCVTGGERVLIYEFFEMGNLDICLHGLSKDSSASRLTLFWEARHKIIRGVANGLAYMHDLEKPIIHRDIKAENIFLDSEFEAHIADFGLARMVEFQNTHVSTQEAGTVGYIAPEYEEGCAVARVKGDVYAFGILMLEVATGKQPRLSVSMDGKRMSFMKWARHMVAQNREREMLVPNLGRGLDVSKIQEYFKIALMCTNPIPAERPTMRNAVELLAQNST